CVNRGQPRRANGQVALRPHRLTTGLKLSDLASDVNNFAAMRCIDPEEHRFIIHFAVSRFPLLHMENGRRHTCQAARFAHFFPDDTGESGANDGSWCESGGDSGYSTPEDPNAEDSDIEELPLSISFRPTLLTSTPPRRPRRPQEPSRRPLEAERTLLEHLPRRPLEAQRTLGTLTANALPSRIWDSPWTPPEYNGTEFNLTNFKATVYTETIVAPPEHLYISGTSFTEGKEALKDAMLE
ncbi:hypothetical protein H0H93_016923, partial [Arthromyces matolae]